MRPGHFLLFIFLFFTFASNAQPVRSPKARATAESQWMQDSLHTTAAQMEKINPILLNYQQQMDQNYGNDKKQKDLMQEKDSSLKGILSKEQYKIYYRREEQIRALPKRNHTGPHQPY